MPQRFPAMIVLAQRTGADAIIGSSNPIAGGPRLLSFTGDMT
jgi:hypothetical protein